MIKSTVVRGFGELNDLSPSVEIWSMDTELQTLNHALLEDLLKFRLDPSCSMVLHAGPRVIICELDEFLGGVEIFRFLDPEAYPSGLRSKSVGESRPALQHCRLVALCEQNIEGGGTVVKQ